MSKNRRKKMIKNGNLLMSKLHEKPAALKREHPALKKRNLLTFLYLWIIFALLDPDPDCKSGSGYGSRDPLNSDPG
jgi:hypothetical protein